MAGVHLNANALQVKDLYATLFKKGLVKNEFANIEKKLTLGKLTGGKQVLTFNEGKGKTYTAIFDEEGKFLFDRSKTISDPIRFNTNKEVIHTDRTVRSAEDVEEFLSKKSSGSVNNDIDNVFTSKIASDRVYNVVGEDKSFLGSREICKTSYRENEKYKLITIPNHDGTNQCYTTFYNYKDNIRNGEQFVHDAVYCNSDKAYHNGGIRRDAKYRDIPTMRSPSIYRFFNKQGLTKPYNEIEWFDSYSLQSLRKDVKLISRDHPGAYASWLKMGVPEEHASLIAYV